MALINLTPHLIVVRTDGVDITIPTSGVARVTSQQELERSIDLYGIKIPVQRTIFGQVEGLPDPQPDTIYIVSSLVLGALKGSRPDVVAPDTGPTAIRDGNGQIVAVTRFQVI